MKVPTLQQQLYSEIEIRDKQILDLEGQLLRVDHKYAKILSTMKRRHEQEIDGKDRIIHTIVEENKLLKREQKRVQRKIGKISEGYGQAQRQMSEMKMKIIQNQNKYELIKRENRQLQSLLKKHELKSNEISKMNKKLKSVNEKMQSQIGKLKQKLRRDIGKRKQLEQFIHKQAIRTQKQFMDVQNNVKQQLQTTTKEIFEENKICTQLTLQSNHHRHTHTNEWQIDMKALKNCIQYGQTYLLQFDPSTFYHQTTYHIYHYMKKLLVQCLQVKLKEQENRGVYQKQLSDSRLKLQQFMNELNMIKMGHSYTLQTQTQTINNANDDNSNKILLQSLIQSTTKLKMKNNLYVQMIYKFCMFYVCLREKLQKKQQKLEYYRIFEEKHFIQKNKDKGRLKLKLKNAFRAVFFIQVMRKRRKSTLKQIPQQVIMISNRSLNINNRLVEDVYRRQIQRVQNLQIQKLKEYSCLTNTEMMNIVLSIVEYGRLKCVNDKQIPLPEYLWKFKYGN